MLLPPLDSIDMTILRLIQGSPEITTREIQNVIFLSRTQVLRRLKQLEEQNLITKANGIGKTYRYRLSAEVNPLDLFESDRDLAIRESLLLLLQGIKGVGDQLVDMATSVENLLR